MIPEPYFDVLVVILGATVIIALLYLVDYLLERGSSNG